MTGLWHPPPIRSLGPADLVLGGVGQPAPKLGQVNLTHNRSDVNTLRIFFRLIQVIGACIELRVFDKAGNVAAGYFDSVDAAVTAVQQMPPGVSICATINPVPLAFLARGKNVMRGNWKAVKAGIATEQVAALTTVCDDDISFERLFVVDIDAIRNPKDISATDVELAAAKVVAENVRSFFRELGIDSVLACSGNGWHIYVLLPQTQFNEARKLQRHAVLKFLSARVSTPAADVDTKIANPARIMKVIGTVASKGADSPEIGRPWRQSHFEDFHELQESTNFYQIMQPLLAEKTVAEAPLQQPAQSSNATGLSFVDKYLETAPAAVSGQNGHAVTFKVACNLARMGLPGDDLFAAMKKYNLKCSPQWTDAELRHKVTDAESAVGNAPQTHGKLPQVILPGDGQRITDAAVELAKAYALQPVEKQLYKRGGMVVALTAGGQLQPVDAVTFQSDLERVAALSKPNGKKRSESAVCSKVVADSILSCREFKDALPEIKLVAPFPIPHIDQNGQMDFIVGFDRQLGIYADGVMPCLPSVEKSMVLIKMLFRDFRFQTPSDFSRAVAFLLSITLVWAQIISMRCPLFVVGADLSQTGKGFLCKLIYAVWGIKTGIVNAKVGGLGGLEESFDRMIINGFFSILLDNLRGLVDSQKIESFQTEDSYHARALRTEMVIEPRRIVVGATSNQAHFTADLANRSVFIDLLKQPADYQFQRVGDKSFLEYVKANRHLFQSAVFSILKCWWDAGHAQADNVPHDFKDWARPMSAIIETTCCLPPLFDGHAQVKAESVTPQLQWFRQVCLAVRTAGRVGQGLAVNDIAGIIDQQGMPVPGAEGGSFQSMLDPQRQQVFMSIGRKLGMVFGDRIQVQVGGFAVSKTVNADASTAKHGPRASYVFTPSHV